MPRSTPLGWTGPHQITAKLLFAQVCKGKHTWDESLPEGIKKQWNQYTEALKDYPTVTVPRTVCTRPQSQYKLFGFADASKEGVCAAIYVVEYYHSDPVNQQLLVAKTRIAPSDQTIPRMELIAAVTLAKLHCNVV